MNTSYFKSIFKKIELEPAIIRKVVTCQQTISKKHSHSVGRYLSPRYLSGDTGLRIHCFASLSIDHNMDGHMGAQYQAAGSQTS